MPNIRLINNRREEAGRFLCDIEDVSRLQFILRDLTALRRLEPDKDWHIETRTDRDAVWGRAHVHAELTTPCDHTATFFSHFQSLTASL